MTITYAIEEDLDAEEFVDVLKRSGLARSVTDFAYCCYLSDLAVDRECQRQGIGKELMRRTQEASGGGKVALLLLSAPDGMDYYRKAGLEKFDNCFGIRRTKRNQDDDQGL